MDPAGALAPRVAAQLSVTRGVYAPGAWQPPHDHPFASLTLVLAGSLSETVGGRTEEAGPLSVVVKPPLVRHADRIGPRGAATVRLTLPVDEHRALVEEGLPLQEWRWIHGGPVARALLSLADAARAGSTESLISEAWDALARVGGPLAPSQDPPRWLARVREEIDDRIGAPPRVRDLASEAGVHPVYLARQFRRYFGCSVVAYRRWRRARRAAALIGDSGLGLADVAHRCGFADHAHLSREFRSLVGVGPRAFRRQARL